MLQSINPAVSGDVGGRWGHAVACFALGALAGAGASFGTLVVVAFAMDGLHLGGALLSAALIATILAVGRELGIKVPVPYRRCQVPITWRQEMSIRRFSFVYGLSLGMGFWTLFVTSAHLGVLVGLVAEPRWGVAVLATFAYAAGKTIPLLATGSSTWSIPRTAIVHPWIWKLAARRASGWSVPAPTASSPAARILLKESMRPTGPWS